MTGFVYLDTGALVRRAESLAAHTDDRNRLIGPVIEAILDDPTKSIACSEITLVEFHDVLTTDLRKSELPSCDDAWWEAARQDLWLRIESGRITVLETPPRAFDQVMALVTLATRKHARKLRAWDALHLMIAARWAHEIGEVVTVVTADADLDVAIDLGFGGRIAVLNLDVEASTGCGANRAPRAATQTA